MSFIVPFFRISHRTRFRMRQIEKDEWADIFTVDLSRQGERLLESIPRHK